MKLASSHIFAINELHSRYPIGTQHEYLFTPEKYAFLDLHPIERTFIKENKSYWRNVARSNIKQLKKIKSRATNLESIFNEQSEKISNEQAIYKIELAQAAQKHQLAINIALQHRSTGFGFTQVKESEAKKLIVFYRALQLVNQSTENSVFKGNILETVLGIIQKKVFFEDASESLCGLDNGPILKRLIAKLNCHGNYDNEIFCIQIITQELSEKLARLAKQSGYRMPAYCIGDLSSRNIITHNR